MVVRPDLGATQAAKEALRHIGASTVERIRLAMVDPVSLVTGVEHVPMRSLVGVDGRAGLDNSMDGLDPIAFMLADEREHVAVTLAHDHARLALARLLGEKATHATVYLVFGRLNLAVHNAHVWTTVTHTQP